MLDHGTPHGTGDRSEHLFVVRIWQEPDRLGPERRRGSIEHVPSGQRLYFTSLADMNDFITLRLSPVATED
jgi:hypothetical protein